MSDRSRRPQQIVLAVAAGLVAVLIGAAAMLAGAQSRARDGLTDRLRERTETMARFARSTFVESFRERQGVAREALQGRTPAEAVARYVDQVADEGSRTSLLDSSGRVLATLPADGRAFAQRLATMDFVGQARRTGWAVSGALTVGGQPAFAVAARARVPAGDYVFLDTGPLEALQQFFKPLLGGTPGTPGGIAALVDDTGRALATSSGPPGRRMPGGLLDAAARQREGSLDVDGDAARFVATPVAGMRQRVLVTAPEHALFASAAGPARWLPWMLLGALAALGAAAVALLRRLMRRTQELVAASVAKTEFLAAASHELRTPLNGIIGFGQLLHDEKLGPVDDVQREALADILGCGNHLLDVVSGLLDVTRVESGTIEIRTEPMSVHDLLHDVSAGLGALAQATVVQIDVEVDPDLPSLVLLDRTRLRQVLFNYISNALKHSAPGEHITVRARKDSRSVCFEVEDHGPGVPSDALERLFTRYGRVPGSPEGTGLGLAVTRHIVEAHGGTVGVESRPGEGATFWARLPLVAVPDPKAVG